MVNRIILMQPLLELAHGFQIRSSKGFTSDEQNCHFATLCSGKAYRF
ncbi:hypothetical protein [Pseudoalteromonas lipolytica]|uniref:Uncharacterized protein n=1 Tax=Pseudoalteromonas lipolytica TaxID=570156 RepID=A0ABU8SWR4_9GAMM